MTTALAEAPRVTTRPPQALSRRARADLAEVLWRGIVRDPLNYLGQVATLNEHAAEGEDAVQAFPVCAPCAMDPAANVAWQLVPATPFPHCVCRAHGRRHKPYFAPLVRRWQREELILDEKSRQLMASWLYVELFAWDALRRPGLKIAFQSLNFPKACELVERAAFSYRTLPRELQRFGSLSDERKAKARLTEGRLVFHHPSGVASEIFAIPNGGTQTRSYTFTGILQDECAFWEPDAEFEESYAAAIPTVKGGGKLVAISSVNTEGHFFYRLLRGQT